MDTAQADGWSETLPYLDKLVDELAKGKAMDLRALPGSEVRASVRIGGRCATGRAPLRQTPKALLAP